MKNITLIAMEESTELLIESIVDAVESTDDRDMQFEKVKTVLIDNGIIEIEESANEENREGKKMWYLAACDCHGKCIGFLKKDRNISTDPDSEMESLMSFKEKKDTNEIAMQINLSHALLKDGCEYRVTPVKC